METIGFAFFDIIWSAVVLSSLRIFEKANRYIIHRAVLKWTKSCASDASMGTGLAESHHQRAHYSSFNREASLFRR
jgi:hypothetical protein